MAYSDNLEDLLKDINTLTKAAKYNLSEMIVLESNKILNILETHPNFMNVRTGTSIPVLDKTANYKGFSTVKGNNCTLPSCEVSNKMSTFTWDLGQIGCKFEICFETLSTDFKTFWDLWQTYSDEDINTAFINFVAETFREQLTNAIFRVAYFGDKTSGNESIDATDGFVKQMQSRAYANPERLVVITENAATTVQGQILKDGEKIYEYFSKMYEQFTEIPGHDLQNSVWRLDRQLVSAWVSYLNRSKDASQYNCNCINPDSLVASRVFTLDNLLIFGLKVEVYDFTLAMDHAGEPWYNDSTGLYDNRNIMILTNRSTMQLGFEIEETKNSTDIKYDDLNDKIIFKGRAIFGAGVPTDIFVIGIGAESPDTGE